MALNLANVDADKLKDFLGSFDNVLCDCDGVIWHLGTLIPGADQSVSKLKTLGKKVRFVTNNSYLGLKNFCGLLKRLGIEVDQDDVANPCLAIIHYLKKIEFAGNVCVLGSKHFKQEIRSAGFNIVDLEAPDVVDDDMEKILGTIAKAAKSVESVGAVIFDIDLNLNYVKLSAVVQCLQNRKVLFLTASTDRTIPVTPTMHAIGTEYFIKPVEDLTGRVPMAFGKPATKLNEFLIDKFNIKDPSRTLFIGDSIKSDIEFASSLGYQTLLVLTGSARLEDIKNCTNKASIPNYYLNSLGDLHDVIKTKLDN